MFCVYCGHQNVDDAMFCMKCGKKFNNQPMESAGPSAQSTAPQNAPQNTAPQQSFQQSFQQTSNQQPSYQQPSYQQTNYQQSTFNQSSAQDKPRLSKLNIVTIVCAVIGMISYGIATSSTSEVDHLIFLIIAFVSSCIAIYLIFYMAKKKKQ